MHMLNHQSRVHNPVHRDRRHCVPSDETVPHKLKKLHYFFISTITKHHYNHHVLPTTHSFYNQHPRLPPQTHETETRKCPIPRSIGKRKLGRFPLSPLSLTIDGTPVAEVKRLVSHWKNKYDWRIHEAKLNTLPQFTLPIQVEGFNSLNIHFVHQLSTRKDAIPLLFVHGWPGHFHEVVKILPLLTEPPEGEQAFRVIAPSIPGFAFSDNPTTKGYNLHKIAETFNKLMIALGYNTYVAQGGDWGSSTVRMLGLLYPENCKGVHVNLLKAVEPPKLYKNPWMWIKMNSQLFSYTKEEEALMARSRWFIKEEIGYRV